MGIDVDMKGALQELQNIVTDIDEQINNTLAQAGEEVVQIALDTHTYKNQTGNLSASIGYGVYHNGDLVKYGGFEESLIGGKKGLDALQDLSQEMSAYDHAIAVVAGMDYAEEVNRKGYVVLDDAELSADEIVSRLLNQISV